MTEKPTVKIRRARPDDAQAIASLGSRVFSASFGYSMAAPDLEHYLHQSYGLNVIKAEIADSKKHFIVADIDGTVIGFSQLTEGTTEPCIANAERPVELQRLYIDQSQQGAGLAQRLVDHIESIAREHGYKVIWLGVWEENYRAQKFYTKMGYTRVGEHDFVMGACVQTDWILSKAL